MERATPVQYNNIFFSTNKRQLQKININILRNTCENVVTFVFYLLKYFFVSSSTELPYFYCFICVLIEIYLSVFNLIKPLPNLDKQNVRLQKHCFKQNKNDYVVKYNVI